MKFIKRSTGVIFEPNSEMVEKQLRKNTEFEMYDGQNADQSDEKLLSSMNKGELIKVAQNAKIALHDSATKAEIIELIKAVKGD